MEATSHRTRMHTFQSKKSKSSNPNVTNLKATKPTHTLSKGPVFETNHEHTLYVPYVFRNRLILGQQGPRPFAWQRSPRSQWGSRMMSQAEPAGARGAKGRRIKSACAAARFPINELS